MGVGSVLVMMLLSANPELPGRATDADQTKPRIKTVASPMASAVDLGAKWGIVTSVKRSPAHNRAVGGAPNSYHLAGRAIDIARRPGVRHADLEAAYRKAGYVLLESLDEGDHSHFAFGVLGQPSKPAAQTVRLASAQASPDQACPVEPSSLAKTRRRPDRFGSCVDEPEPAPRLRPLELAE